MLQCAAAEKKKKREESCREERRELEGNSKLTPFMTATDLADHIHIS
jgi:hypothetical protein